MLTVVYRNKFKKNLDLLIRRGKDPEKIKSVAPKVDTTTTTTTTPAAKESTCQQFK